jgi:ATP citrate (pro-S)-lyase
LEWTIVQMARKKVREYDGKCLIVRHLAKLNAAKLGGGGGRAAQVTAAAIGNDPIAFYACLARAQPWLLTSKLVVKPDMLFGKRGKNNLVLLKADYAAVQQFIAGRMGKQLEVSGVTGTLTAFIIEPFVPHADEYYLSIQTHRNGDILSFGACGGVDIEDNWDKVKTVLVPAGLPDVIAVLSREEHVMPLLTDPLIPAQSLGVLADFIASCYHTYVDLDMTMLEMNPLAIDMQGLPAILDSRVELDSYATFKNMKVWGGDLEFPEPWGREKCEEERIIQALDDKSGASMKLSVLNENGRIWTMVAGGGASVIYADTVVDIGCGNELGNYAEYSGNPKEQETYMYARTLLNLVTRNPDGRRRALLIGGGVANFTDVAATFTGIQQALKDFHGKLQGAKVKVYVRRGGPNYKNGLRMMEDLGRELEIPIEVYGPDSNMTHICRLAADWVQDREGSRTAAPTL